MDYCCRGSGFLGQNRAVAPDWVTCQQGSTVSLTDSALSSRKSPFALPQRQHCISQSPLSPIARCGNCFSFISDPNYLPQNVPQRPSSVDARCRRRLCCQQSLRREYLLSPPTRPGQPSNRTQNSTHPSEKCFRGPIGSLHHRETAAKSFFELFFYFSSLSETALLDLRLTCFSLAKCRTCRRPGPHLRRSQGLSHRGLFHSRAAYSWCPGGVQPR